MRNRLDGWTLWSSCGSMFLLQETRFLRVRLTFARYCLVRLWCQHCLEAPLTPTTHLLVQNLTFASNIFCREYLRIKTVHLFSRHPAGLHMKTQPASGVSCYRQQLHSVQKLHSLCFFMSAMSEDVECCPA